MKLVRFGDSGAEKPGLIDQDGRIRDLSPHADDISGDVLSAASLERLAMLDPSDLRLVDGEPRLGPCVGKVGKFIAIGLNYSDHAAETGNPIPSEPEVFTKAVSCISGPNDPIVRPRTARKIDWEIELGIVIGQPAKYVERAQARNFIAGYCIVNDVSERNFQLERGTQWVKGKSADTFGPIGPWLVTAEEVGNPQALKMELTVNGQTMQEGSTAKMIFPCEMLVSYLSQFMTLYPGDIITTGTPPGVGAGHKPPIFLADGDVVTLTIDKLGKQTQRVVGEGGNAL